MDTNRDKNENSQQQPSGNIGQFGKSSGNIENRGTTDSSSPAPNNTTGSGESRQTEITLPVGGGAIRGIGEKFQANPVTGTASFTVPLTISEGRGGFTPQLALSYDSGSGNSIFGLGWSVGLPSITRKTDKGLPQYNDNANHESDVFILSGAEDLVPVLKGDGKQFFRTEDGYTIYSYQPRTEGLFALIERWVKDGISHWRTISKENITSVYGLTEKARIFDLDNERKIFSWLIEESWDAKGNLMQFTYKQENEENVPDTCYEKNRKSSFTNRYLKKVSYGNIEPCTPLATTSNYDKGFHFHLVFDYGEYADNTFTPNKTWEARPDAFSSYKACFEIRTHRLCRRVLMFHHFEDLGSKPVLVRSTDLKYDKTPAFTLLKSVTHTGYNESKEDSLPSLTFTYTQARIADIFREVPEDMLRQLPAGVDGQNYQWADLYSDGVSGILTMNNHAWYFKPNYGDKQYQSPPVEGCCCCNNEDEIDRAKHTPFFGNMRSEVPRPAAANNQRTTFRLNDVDSDGYPELVIQGDGIHGYYTRDEDGKWLNFRNFQDNPNINYNDSNLRFVDLSGDGLADIVISKGETFDIYFSEGKKGFGNYRRVRCGHEYGNAPQVVFSDPKQRVFLADMSGDGLTDIVKITNQSIVYWPNMGYGRFGEQVVMSNPPLLDSLDQFDTRFVHLTDVDGTGTADLLYISKGRIRYFKNLSGNRWEEEVLPATIAASATQQNFIQTTDLLGNGTQCVVISSSLPAQAKKMRYWELTSGIKPFLLNEINNNMGGITRLHYAPSTKFYMQDKFNGTPWITKLPFPVQTLEKVEIIDLVGNKHFTNRYAYHHGYWDPVEREFRGFGMVEQWDCENYASGIRNDELTINNEQLIISNEVSGRARNDDREISLDTPPVYTKTWFHTGFFRSRDRISNLFWEEYFRGDGEAWFLPDTVLPYGLTGAEAREACRALRGSPLRIEVYAQDGTDKEKIPYTVEEKNYKLQCLQEKGQNRHAVFLKTDAESLMYHYERQVDDPRILHRLVLGTDDYGNEKEVAEIAYPRREPEFKEQEKILATYTANDFINVANIEENDYRLIGVLYQTKRYEIHNLEYTGKKFEVKELSGSIDNATEIDYETAPTTDLQKRLFQHTKTLFWNKECTQSLLLSEIAPHALLYQQQSLELTGKLIYRYNLDNVGEITDPLLTDSGYLQENSQWFVVSEIQHFDYEDFYLPKVITDPFGNETKLKYDQYSLFPVGITDALNFKTTAEYDYRVLQAWKLVDKNENSQEVEFDILGMVTKLAVMGKNGEGDTLKDPTEKYAYDLHCWKNEQKPVYAHVEKRETHGVYYKDTRWVESYVYTDGLGNEIMTKSTAADGLAWGIVNNVPVQDNTTNRWLASGKVIYNNKGLAVKQYEPWFSNTHEFTFEDILTHFGVTPIMHYDPLGRLIQTDFPDESTSRVEFDAWRQENYDQNDCDENSPHYKTPQVLDLDVLGRSFQTTDDNGIFGESCVTHNQLDITGRITVVTDGLGREKATLNMYALSEEHLLTVDNIDSGKRWLLNDTTGKPVKKWDRREHEFTFYYDELQRLTDTLVKDVCIERLLYGTSAQGNNIGQIVKSLAQDGVTGFEYDFKGNVIKQIKVFAEDYQSQLNWNGHVSLLNEFFTTETTYDALNRPNLITQPDGQTLYYGYDKGGLLDFVQRNDKEVHISNIEYNEKEQRLNIYYGNETKTRYDYNPLNFRLKRILTTRKEGTVILQDLNYVFDKVGNIIKITDDAQQTHYFKNQVIEPVSTYEYDALYRLIVATGRELTNLAMPTHEDFANDIPVPNTDSNAMQNYTHKYQYDVLGNILKMRADNWTRDNEYAGGNNYLLRHNGHTNQYTYDKHGNMLTMPHLKSIVWNSKDEMAGATDGQFTSYYNYDAGGNRTRKTVDKGNIIETRYYIGGYEVYRKVTNGTLNYERTTLNISDDEKVFVRIEQESGKEVIRYQFDNHLGSACLELDDRGYIISYEEYHPFGTTSYRAGRDKTEVSQKRYKYNGKERDEETGLYMYGMRYYAAWICRFVSVDPLQFEYPELTPFQYASNRPITMVDLDGAEADDPNKYKIHYDGKIEVQRTGGSTNTYTYVKEDGTEVELGVYNVTTNSSGEKMIKVGEGATGSNDIFSWAGITSGNLYFEEDAFAGLLGAVQNFYDTANTTVDKVRFNQFMSLEKKHSSSSKKRTSAFDVAYYYKSGKVGAHTDSSNISDDLNKKLGDSFTKFGLGSSGIYSQAGGSKGAEPYLLGTKASGHHHHFHFEGFSGKITEVSNFDNPKGKEKKSGERWKANYEGEQANTRNATWVRGKWGALRLIRK